MLVSSEIQISQEGNAECIANEDGERQIACAVSFHGEEMVRCLSLVDQFLLFMVFMKQYIGNQAKSQLVKNAQNTITGFRNLLGKK
jgi:molecular chaperone DnaK (HSP70)